MMSNREIDCNNQVSMTDSSPSTIVEDFHVKQILGNITNCSIGNFTLNIGSTDLKNNEIHF